MVLPPGTASALPEPRGVPVTRATGAAPHALEQTGVAVNATLRELAAQAATQPGRLAFLVLPYARLRGWDDAALAAALGCSLDVLPNLLLGRNPFADVDDPDSPLWKQDLLALARTWGTEPGQLEAVLHAARDYQLSRPSGVHATAASAGAGTHAQGWHEPAAK